MRRYGKGEDDPQRELTGVVQRNIRAMLDVRRRSERRKRPPDRIADAITRFTGSMLFVGIHAAVLLFWLLWNTGVIPNNHRFDPYPFVMLAMVASVEAIFLTSFVLISQNRMQEMADKRADLDLQINLLSEHEVTRLIQLTEAIAQHLNVKEEALPNVEELKRDVRPERVLSEIESTDKHDH